MVRLHRNWFGGRYVYLELADSHIQASLCLDLDTRMNKHGGVLAWAST